MKHSNLPPYIIKINRHFYKNCKTNQFIHKSKLSDHIPKHNSEVKQEMIQAKRWDLNYD